LAEVMKTLANFEHASQSVVVTNVHVNYH